MSTSYGQPSRVGKCFGVLARNASDGIAAFDLLRDKYDLDRADKAQIEFIKARETLEPALVEHILCTGNSAVHAALCERVDDLTVEAREDLLSRKDPRVVEAILDKSLIGKASVKTQLRWATSDDGAMRISVIADSRVDDEVAAQALPGLVKTLVESQTELHNTDLVESLTSRFGYEAAADVVRLAGLSKARSTEDQREATLSNGDLDAVVGEVEEEMLSGDEFELLTQRDIDSKDKFTLRDFEKALVDRHPRSRLLGEYQRAARAGRIVESALAIEDAARVYTLAQLISRRGPDEIGSYLYRREVDLMPLLELSERIGDISVHDACVILS